MRLPGLKHYLTSGAIGSGCVGGSGWVDGGGVSGTFGDGDGTSGLFGPGVTSGFSGFGLWFMGSF
jgi:hypothetical protein